MTNWNCYFQVKKYDLETTKKDIPVPVRDLSKYEKKPVHTPESEESSGGQNQGPRAPVCTQVMMRFENYITYTFKYVATHECCNYNSIPCIFLNFKWSPINKKRVCIQVSQCVKEFLVNIACFKSELIQNWYIVQSPRWT